MDLVLHIPDDVTAQLSASGDVERQALEGLALESFRAGRLTKSELRRQIGIPSGLELDAFLKARDVCEPYTVEDLDRERATFERLGF